MGRKECYFGSAKVEKRGNGHEVLTIGDYFGDCEISVHDAEIKENEESIELVGISIVDSSDNKQELFIHKKDCLQLATFLLNIHTEYANKINELDFQDYSKQFSREG